MLIKSSPQQHKELTNDIIPDDAEDKLVEERAHIRQTLQREWLLLFVHLNIVQNPDKIKMFHVYNF